MNMNRSIVPMLVVLVGLWGYGKAYGDVSMNFNTLTISPYINFSNLYSGSPADESANLATYQTDTPGAWYGGNYVPDQFHLATLGGKSVLQLGINFAQYQYNFSTSEAMSFAPPNQDLQGMRYDTNLSGTKQTLSLGAYIDPSWISAPTNPPDPPLPIVNFGMEGIGVDAHGNVVSRPVIAYLYNDLIAKDAGLDTIFGYSVPGFYAYDYAGISVPSSNLTGPQWYLLAPASSSGFNTVGFTLTVGKGIQYYLNGSPVGGLYPDTAATSLQSVMLYARNPFYSTSYPDQIYSFDNFAATSSSAVPEPPTAAIVFAGGLGLLAVATLRRRRWVAA